MDNTSSTSSLDSNINTGNAPMNLSVDSLADLRQTAKWGKFLSIMGFIGTGCMVFFALFAGSILPAMNAYGTSPMPFPSIFITIFYLLMALLYFFPVLYLYKFSNRMKTAIQEEDRIAMDDAFRNLKSLFKFMGILTIIMLAVYALIFIFVIIAAMAGASAM